MRCVLRPVPRTYSCLPDRLHSTLPAARSYGFVIEREEWRRCGYTHNARSMYKMEYDCIFFVARWPAASRGRGPPGGPPPPPPPNQ